MTRRLPASASDASRAALNSSKQREAPPLPPDLLNLREDLVVSVSYACIEGVYRKVEADGSIRFYTYVMRE